MGVTVGPMPARFRGQVEPLLRACGPVFSEEEIGVAVGMADEALRGEYVILSAAVGPRLAGYCLAGPTPLTQSTWHLYWLCVHPDSQRLGVARTLQAALDDVVRSGGGQRIVAETGGRADYDAARAFYCSAGYAECGRIEDYYRPGDACFFYCRVLGSSNPKGD